MNCSVLFPNSPILSLPSLEQSQSAVPADKERRTVDKRKGKTAHRRRRQCYKRKPNNADSVVTVLFNGREHGVKLYDDKRQGVHQTASLAAADKKKLSSTMKTNKKKRAQKQSKSKTIVKNTSQKRKNATYHKSSKDEIKGMLPEEQAYRRSIQPVEQRNDVSPIVLNRKRDMLKTIERVSKCLSLQEHVLPEERSYQLMIRPQEALRRRQILDDLGEMKRRISQGILPNEKEYRKVMDEAALLATIANL